MNHNAKNATVFVVTFILAFVIVYTIKAHASLTGPATPPPSLAVCEVTVTSPYACRVDCGGGNTAECHASTIGGTGGAGYSLCKFSDGSLHGYTGNVCY